MTYELKSPILGLEQISKVEFSEIDERFVLIRGLKEDGSYSGIDLRLVNPYTLKQDYSFDIPTSIEVLTDINTTSKVKIYCTILFQEPIESSRINFLAPLIFNEDNQTAAQIILEQKDYPHFGVADPISDYIKIYKLKSPILGLEQITQVEFKELDELFVQIRGLKEDGSDTGISLTLVNPSALKKQQYNIKVSDSLEEMMEIKLNSSVSVYCPVVLQEPIQKSFVNFLAPIIFHTDNFTAAQIALQAQEYPDYGVSEPIEQYL